MHDTERPPETAPSSQDRPGPITAVSTGEKAKQSTPRGAPATQLQGTGLLLSQGKEAAPVSWAPPLNYLPHGHLASLPCALPHQLSLSTAQQRSKRARGCPLSSRHSTLSWQHGFRMGLLMGEM